MSIQLSMTRATVSALLGFAFLMRPVDAAAEKAEFRYPSQADHLLLEYSAHSGFPYYGEPHLGLKIFGDGRAIASLPEHYPNAALEYHGIKLQRRGVFETRLTAEEIQQILEGVAVALSVDLLETRRRKAASHPGKGYTDSALFKLRVNVDDYRPAGGQWSGPVHQDIEWPSPAAEARLYPAIEGIRAIDEACRAAAEWLFRLAARANAEEQQQ